MAVEGYELPPQPRGERGLWGRRTDPLVIRMLARINKMALELAPGLGPCWEWTGARNGHGYGVLRDEQGKLVLAHRVSLSLKLRRPIRTGYLANHRCNQKWCVRPAHLYEGTSTENYWDWINSKKLPPIEEEIAQPVEED